MTVFILCAPELHAVARETWVCTSIAAELGVGEGELEFTDNATTRIDAVVDELAFGLEHGRPVVPRVVALPQIPAGLPAPATPRQRSERFQQVDMFGLTAVSREEVIAHNRASRAAVARDRGHELRIIREHGIPVTGPEVGRPWDRIPTGSPSSPVRYRSPWSPSSN